MRTIPARANTSVSNAARHALEQKNEYLIETEYICLNGAGWTGTHPVLFLVRLGFLKETLGSRVDRWSIL